MGGYAFVIKGSVEGEYYNLFKNITRDTPNRARIVTSKGEILKMSWGPNDKRVTLPAERYQILVKDFINYTQKVDKPWESSESLFHYFGLNIIEVFLRGAQRNDNPEPEFYIQLNFRGCSGMCETSSAMGTHWAKLWFDKNKTRLVQEYFSKLGFVLSDEQGGFNEKFSFLPIGKLGYARYNPNWLYDTDNEMGYSRVFQVDGAVTDALHKNGTFKQFSLLLDKHYSELMKDRKHTCKVHAFNY